MVFQHKEGRTSGNDAGTFSGDAFQDLGFGLHDFIGLDTLAVPIVSAPGLKSDVRTRIGHGSHHLQQIRQPVLLLSFDALDFIGGKFELLHETLDEVFVAVMDLQLGGQFAADGASAGTQFTADGNNEVLLCVHKCKYMYFFRTFVKI